MTTNLHDKMLAAIDAYFSASDGTEAEVAENLLLDVRDEINKQKYVPETNFGNMAEPKIGCVNHDCDKCKAAQPSCPECVFGMCHCGAAGGQKQPAPVQEPVGCEGAIVNGRVYADRLERDYQFECEAGPLHLCNDWVEFRRCFEWLATHPTPPAAQPAVQREHITDGRQCWCNPDIDYVDPETGAAVIVHKEPQ
jgi:hypothetical protein